jgi:hypothetical protein
MYSAAIPNRHQNSYGICIGRCRCARRGPGTGVARFGATRESLIRTVWKAAHLKNKLKREAVHYWRPVHRALRLGVRVDQQTPHQPRGSEISNERARLQGVVASGPPGVVMVFAKSVGLRSQHASLQDVICLPFEVFLHTTWGSKA